MDLYQLCCVYDWLGYTSWLYMYTSKIQAIKDIHIIVAVMILVALDVLVILFYFLLAGLREELGAILIPNRENPSDSIGVSWYPWSKICNLNWSYYMI